MSIADDRSSKRKRKREALKDFRRDVLARAKVRGGWKCERCGKVFPTEGQIHAHHRLLRSQGGSNCVTNGAALCWTCHDHIHLHYDDGLSHWSEWIVTRNTLGKIA